jgi:Glycosyl hydrolase-like 10
MLYGAETKIELSDDHTAAVNRRRRIVVQEDPVLSEPLKTGISFEQWRDYLFNYADEQGSQIDSVFWDLGSGYWAIYRSELLPASEMPIVKRWRDQGIDFVQLLIEECRKRNIEAFWNQRTSEVDIAANGVGLSMDSMNPVKKAHPDWVIRSWWWQGLWDLSSPGARHYRLQVLHELAANYDFDGIQLDFARHAPCLPPGRQWELREGVTEYVRQARSMLLELEKKRGRPYLLAARVPESLHGCHLDGFDVEVWAQENLIDIFTLGERSSEVNLADFRRIVAGKNIKLQPCLDDHHATDGYRSPPVEFFRGVFGNWWQQGADSVVTFNWSCASPQVAELIGAKPGPICHRQGYHCIGSPETLRYKDKLFTVQRKGGYPWSEGYFCRNEFAPLPVQLANEGTPAVLTIDICDHLNADTVKDLELSCIFHGVSEGDRFGVKLNGVDLDHQVHDFQWKDPQIFTPKPQPASGGGPYEVDPNQRLMKLAFKPLPAQFRLGRNEVSIRIADRVPYKPGANIQIEKLEVAVKYG